MAPAKKFQFRSLLNGLLNNRIHPGLTEADINLVSDPDGGEMKYTPTTSVVDQGIHQEALIEIGPILDIQASIDLLARFKNIQQPVKTIRVDLQDAQVIHGAVIQTLFVIQKSCVASGNPFSVSGLSDEMITFFRLAGLKDLLVDNQTVESR